MNRFNKDYVEEFRNDANYERTLEFWSDFTKTLADEFYNTSIDVGGLDVKISQISNKPNHILIDNAIINAVSDIKRIRDYHQIGKAENLKFAAYVGFWLAKAKPYALKIDDYNVSPLTEKGVLQKGVKNLCFSINEVFITEFVLTVIFANQIPQAVVSISDICLDACNSHNYSLTSKDDVKDLLHYHLCYRLRCAQELELFLKGLLACPIICARAQRRD